MDPQATPRLCSDAALSEQAFVATPLANILSSVERDYPAVLVQALTG